MEWDGVGLARFVVFPAVDKAVPTREWVDQDEGEQYYRISKSKIESGGSSQERRILRSYDALRHVPSGSFGNGRRSWYDKEPRTLHWHPSGPRKSAGLTEHTSHALVTAT